MHSRLMTLLASKGLVSYSDVRLAACSCLRTNVHLLARALAKNTETQQWKWEREQKGMPTTEVKFLDWAAHPQLNMIILSSSQI